MTGKKKKVDFNYINSVMKKSDTKGINKLICITNGNEVLRISKKKAKEYFFKKIRASKEELKTMKSLNYEIDLEGGFYYKRTEGWYYTTKTMYKQYIESSKPNSNIPKPNFLMEIMNKKGEKKRISTHLFTH